MSLLNKLKTLTVVGSMSLVLTACGDIDTDELAKNAVDFAEDSQDIVQEEVDNFVEENLDLNTSTESSNETESLETPDSNTAIETKVSEPKVESNVAKEEPKKPVHTDGTTQKIPVEYVRIVDGDTAKVIYDGQEMSVRYLLIDTPESKHSKIGYQPYGEEASQFNKKLLDNAKQVYLEFDVGARQDHYGRLLAYVWADDILINEAIVREGLAIKAYVKPPSTRHLDRIEKAQELAKKERKNVWSLNDFVQGEDFRGGSKVDGNKHYPQFIKEDDKKNPPKQNNSSKQGSSSSNNSINKSDNNFKNCTELRKVYPDGVPSDHPAYQAKMDRDKDGWACEKN